MNLRIFCERLPWDFGDIAVYIRTRASRHDTTMGRNAVALPMTFKELTASDEGMKTEPAMTLTSGDAQMFMDELWRTGLRPTEGTGSAGCLAATERHLSDMRALVFKQNPPERA